jgi:hypothetical protein
MLQSEPSPYPCNPSQISLEVCFLTLNQNQTFLPHSLSVTICELESSSTLFVSTVVYVLIWYRPLGDSKWWCWEGWVFILTLHETEKKSKRRKEKRTQLIWRLQQIMLLGRMRKNESCWLQYIQNWYKCDMWDENKGEAHKQLGLENEKTAWITQQSWLNWK